MTEYQPATENEPIQVVLEVPDQEHLETLLTTLSTMDVPVETEQITPARLTEDLSVTVDLGMLTEKQQEALELALEASYYEQPRDATLADLADRLDISKSAVSQRLRAAETKLVQNALERYR